MEMKTSEEIFKIILENIITIDPDLSMEAMDYNTRLSSIGLDSIGRAELIAMTSEKIGLDIAIEDLHYSNNIGELAEYLSSELQNRASSK